MIIYSYFTNSRTSHQGSWITCELLKWYYAPCQLGNSVVPLKDYTNMTRTRWDVWLNKVSSKREKYFDAWFISPLLEIFTQWGRDHSGYGFSQWEEALQCNASSHWPSPYPEWSREASRNKATHGRLYFSYPFSQRRMFAFSCNVAFV